MTPEVVASTCAIALLRAGVVARMGGGEDFHVRLEPVDAGNSLGVFVDRRTSRSPVGWIHVDRTGARTYAPDFVDLAFIRPMVEVAFDPASARAAVFQLVRLDLSGRWNIEEHPLAGGTFGVFDKLEPILPRWTVAGVPLTCELYAVPAAARSSVDLEAMVTEMTDGGPPDLRGYGESELRWIFAQPINLELRRIGLRQRFRAHPGGVGEIARVPIFSGVPNLSIAAMARAEKKGRRTAAETIWDEMPGWRVRADLLMARLRELPSTVSDATIAGLLDELTEKPLDLTDWRP